MPELVERPLHNWSGTYRYQARAVHSPRTTAELQSLIARGGSLHALGTRHSFNTIGDAGELISLAELPGEPMINAEDRTVIVPARKRYGDVAEFLQEAGWALSSMASLPHISSRDR